MAIRCSKCNSENSETSRFCADCGTQLGPVKEMPPLTETLKKPAQIIAPGTVFAGRYEILGKIGEGGMGEVYRALDKNLSRPVAIKILPNAFAEDKERLARFEREAKLLAVLNHPNIAAIHGLEEAGGRRFLVLEMAEGETLKTKLDRGPIEVDEALELCRQVAEGLEAAHEKGIIHRDLKPGNIMLMPEGKVKILDFGLAKAYLSESSDIDIATSPTITAQMTEPGVILGTAGYMSPEQARGREVDKRADIWAFGCILYECLTGRRAFPGDTVPDTLAQVLKGEPDWSALPAITPINIKTLLHRCLRKNPKTRLREIGDARIEIDEAGFHPAEERTISRRFPLGWIFAIGMAFILIGVLVRPLIWKTYKSVLSVGPTASAIKLEPGYSLDGLPERFGWPTRTAMVISRDGMFIIYCASKDGEASKAKPQLFMRRLDKLEAKPIPGTEGGIAPFLSPDNRWVGFWAEGKLFKVAVEGGIPEPLCDVKWPFGFSWCPDNQIIYASEYSRGLLRVSGDGGIPEILTEPDKSKNEFSHRLPHCLPDGRSVLFTITKHGWDIEPHIAILDLKTRKWSLLIENASDARFVPSGHVLFLRQGRLMAVPFDLARLELRGREASVIDGVMQSMNTWGSYQYVDAGQMTVSDSGSLVYSAGGILPDSAYLLVWVDQKGDAERIISQKGPYFRPRLSNDGGRIAYALWGRQQGVWIYDIGRATSSLLTDEGRPSNVVWTPDGKRLLFSQHAPSSKDIFWMPVDASSSAEPLLSGGNDKWVGSLSPDGSKLAFVLNNGDNWDINILDLRSRRAEPFLNSQSFEAFPEFSPDGRWLAYCSDESGRKEVYVRPFPGPGGRWQISHQGGTQSVWVRDGRQLFYRSEDKVWVVDTRTEGDFWASKPRLLFTNPNYFLGEPLRGFDVSIDGKRFLMVQTEEEKQRPISEMVLIQNWFEELRRIVPSGKN